MLNLASCAPLRVARFIEAAVHPAIFETSTCGAFMLENLVCLACENSSEKRRELMGRVADHFVEGSQGYSDNELNLFGQVMSKLLEGSDPSSKASIAEQISREANTPRDLTLQLANEEIAVARPMLENSPNLTSNDLLCLARDKGADHRVAISHRSDLNEEITDELIQHGECEVLQAISGNARAPISDWGFGAIAKHAPNDTMIENNLSCRKDMSLAAAKNVLPLLAPRAQQKLIGLIKDDDGELMALIGRAVRKTSKKKIETGKKRINAKQMLSEVRDGKRELDSVISYLAKNDRPMDCALVLSKLSKIPENQVAGSLLKLNGDGIALLCKAVGVGRQAFHDLAVMRYARLNLPSSMADQLTLAYEDIDVATAQRTLRFINVRNSVSKNSSAA